MVATNERIGGHESGVLGHGMNGVGRRGNRKGRTRGFAIFIAGEWVGVGELKAQVDAACRAFWKRRGKAPPSELDWWKLAMEEKRAREREALGASESEGIK